MKAGLNPGILGKSPLLNFGENTPKSCADPESFVRGGPPLTKFYYFFYLLFF